MAARNEAEDLVGFETLHRHGEKIARLEANYNHAATKADIRQLETKIEQLRADLTWRIVIAMSILTGIFVAVVKLPIGAM